ncbi:MAG: DUF2513 domain-containing protein [Planctomycetota bacterium]
MKRDMDLIRQILLNLEAASAGALELKCVYAGHDSNEVHYHRWLILESGLATGLDARTMDEKYNYILYDLTWQGHEFLDASRDEGRWKRTKEICNRASSVTFNAVMVVLTNLATEAIKNGFPR